MVQLDIVGFWSCDCSQVTQSSILDVCNIFFNSKDPITVLY